MCRRSLFVPVMLCLPALATAQTKETIIPAGTLLQCTLDEPDFSSGSAIVGDPVICQARGVQQFGHAMFPRGAYLAGHFVESKDPGHFWGKGWLKLEFDRISLPDMTLPVPGKIVAVRGYRVDREGKILGHGHPRRDAIEWLIPPLWPWKLVSLPARGPLPTLKGETEVTLRLMEDVAVPLAAATAQPAASRQETSRPVEGNLWTPPADWSAKRLNRSWPITYAPPSTPAMQRGPGGPSPTTLAPSLAADSGLTAERWAQQLTLIALKGGTVYGVTDYWIEDGRLFYTFGSGAEGTFDSGDVDWASTIQLNGERGMVITLRTHSH